VALRCVLAPLTHKETVAYISRRIRIAGGQPSECFTDDAIAAIHARSCGIPRTVSVICDNALITGFAADEKPVQRATVLDVCRDFDFQPASERPEPRSGPADNRGGAGRGHPPTEPVAAAVLAGHTAGAPGAGKPHDGLFNYFSRPKRFPFF